MTTEQTIQDVLLEQKQAWINTQKHSLRQRSLELATCLIKTPCTSEELIKEAEILYEYLIRGLNQ